MIETGLEKKVVIVTGEIHTLRSAACSRRATSPLLLTRSGATGGSTLRLTVRLRSVYTVLDAST